MPRPKPGALPRIRKRSDSNTARVTLGGRTFSLGEFGSSKSDARYHELCRQWIEAGRPKTGFNPDGQSSDIYRQPTIDDVVVAYAESLKRRYPDLPNGTHHNQYQTRLPLLRLTRQLFGKSTASSFGPKKFRLLREHFMNGGSNRSRQYINKAMGWFRHMVKWAVSEELMAGSQLEAIRAVQPIRYGDVPNIKESKKVRPVEDSVFERTLPFLPAIVADLVQVQRLTGARCGEICSMRPIDIDTKSVEGVWLYRPVSHKTKHKDRERVIIIGPKAQDILLSYLNRSPTSYCFSPKEQVEYSRREQVANAHCHRTKRTRSQDDQERIVGEKYCTTTVRRAISRACRKALTPPSHLKGKEKEQWYRDNGWSPHMLRHRHATEVRRHTNSLDVAQQILGHADSRTTELYAQIDLTAAIKLMREIG